MISKVRYYPIFNLGQLNAYKLIFAIELSNEKGWAIFLATGFSVFVRRSFFLFYMMISLIGTNECFTDYSIFSDYLLHMNFQRTSKFLCTLIDFSHLFFRYEARRPGDIPQHSSRKASVHVLSHLVQGDSPCLQEIHARCRQLWQKLLLGKS